MKLNFIVFCLLLSTTVFSIQNNSNEDYLQAEVFGGSGMIGNNKETTLYEGCGALLEEIEEDLDDAEKLSQHELMAFIDDCNLTPQEIDFLLKKGGSGSIGSDKK